MALPSKSEIVAAVRGLGLLLRGDDRALLCYDLSLDGFWRSFWLPLVLVVAYALVMQPTAVELAAYSDDRTSYQLIQLVKLLLGWIAYFVVIAGITRMFGLGGRFGIFVILSNWAQAILIAASLPILAGANWGFIPPSVLGGWSTALLPVGLYIVWRIARHGLGTSLSLAFAIAALDVLVPLAMYGLVDLLL